jgi:hypothetical protein
VSEECTLCKSPIRAEIDRALADRQSAKQINSLLRYNNLPEVHRNTVSKHRNLHNRAFVKKRATEIREAAKDLGVRNVPTNRDLAVLARDRAVERLAAGEIDVTLSDGLKAQSLIDARAQKGADHDFMLKIAVLLSGGNAELPDTIEGEFTEEREADEAEMRLLTAG